MRLAFNGQAHYTDFRKGYDLYRSRSRKPCCDDATYRRIVRRYCKMLADKLVKNGIADLPYDMGYLAAATITRKPQYRGKKFIGYGKMDWTKGHFDGKLKTFGIVYLPKRNRYANLRSYGFVANRRLFQRVKAAYNDDNCEWTPIDFTDDMI